MNGSLDIVVAGGGRVGYHAAELLADRSHDVTVVDDDGDRCSYISDQYVATVVEGDATDPGVLKQAGVADCDVVAGLTGNAGTNLAVCLEARELGDGVRTVARIDAPGKRSYERFVDAVVFPEVAGGRVAANEIEGDTVQSLSDVTGDLDVMHVQVAEGAPAAGRDLADVRLPAGALVVSGADGDEIAGPGTRLEPGQRYVVAVEPGVADEVMNLLRG